MTRPGARSAAAGASVESAAAAIEISGLSFAWQRGGTPVLDLEHLRIGRGERVFLKGPSGCGKTTLLNLIGGVLLPRAGRLDVLGRTLPALGAAARDRFRADHIGFIFQMFNLIPYLSVLDNVLLPCRFSRRRTEVLRRRGSEPIGEARRLLAQLDLGEDVLHRSVTALSVGQQQRVAAARALIGGPELLVADEPTSSLDADRRARFIDLLLAECAASSTAVVFVSHDAGLEAAFDRSIDLQAVNRAVAAADGPDA